MYVDISKFMSFEKANKNTIKTKLNKSSHNSVDVAVSKFGALLVYGYLTALRTPHLISYVN